MKELDQLWDQITTNHQPEPNLEKRHRFALGTVQDGAYSILTLGDVYLRGFSPVLYRVIAGKVDTFIDAEIIVKEECTVWRNMYGNYRGIKVIPTLTPYAIGRSACTSFFWQQGSNEAYVTNYGWGHPLVGGVCSKYLLPAHLSLIDKVKKLASGQHEINLSEAG